MEEVYSMKTKKIIVYFPGTGFFAIYVCFSLSYGENYGNELVSNVQCNDSDFPMVVCGAG